jgi:hypothetical protein
MRRRLPCWIKSVTTSTNPRDAAKCRAVYLPGPDTIRCSHSTGTACGGYQERSLGRRGGACGCQRATRMVPSTLFVGSALQPTGDRARCSFSSLPYRVLSLPTLHQSPTLSAASTQAHTLKVDFCPAVQQVLNVGDVCAFEPRVPRARAHASRSLPVSARGDYEGASRQRRTAGSHRIRQGNGLASGGDGTSYNAIPSGNFLCHRPR